MSDYNIDFIYPELQGKRLLLLGGSLWKDAIKEFAAENGIVLTATGNDKTAGIFEIADEVYNIDSTNSKEMKELIKNAKIDGVYLGGNESVISSACQYVNEIGMPCYCTHEQWELLQNKGKFKELCIQNGLPVVPRYKTDSGLENAVPTADYPVITKPTDGCGSHGFSVCHNLEELRKGYAIASSESPTGSVIVEKFVPNDSVCALYTVCDGKLLFTGLQDKYPVRFEKQGSYVGGLFVWESDLTARFRSRFEQRIEKMIQSIGIKEGSFWIEVFQHDDEFYFNEVGFRYGGSATVFFVDYMYRINQVAKDIYFALTGKSKSYGFRSLIPDSVPRKQMYAVYTIICAAGTVKSISGVDAVMRMPNIVKFLIIHGVGAHIADSGSFSQVAALTHFVFNTEDEMKNTIQFIQDNVRFLDENGNDLVIRMLQTSGLRLRRY